MTEGTAEADEARVMRALEPSRRRLVRLGDGRWAVLPGIDRRRRPLAIATEEMVQRLAAEGRLSPVGEDVYALSTGAAARVNTAPLSRWVFVAAGGRRLGERGPGVGFVGMAMQARERRGPIDMRQAQAGLRLIADAERASADARLTMDWDAGPSTKQRRAGSGGGRTGDAVLAGRTLMRLRRKLGETGWRMAWSLCVDGDTLRVIRKRFAISQERLKPVLADVLEKLAEAYER